MTSLNTVVLIATDAKRTKGVLIDSINDFKSDVSRGVVFSTTNISGEWVDLVLRDQPKAVALFRKYAESHEHLLDYYQVSEDAQSVKVTERGHDALTFDNHLNYLKSMNIIDFKNIFNSKADNKPLDYRTNAGWHITSKI